MKQLRLALYAEGPTDERFLPFILERTTERVLAKYERRSVDVVETKIIAKDIRIAKRDESILQAAREAVGFDILFIHSDADHPTAEKALKERFQPGYEKVLLTEEYVCKHLIPIVPVYMTEAWMLVDHEALQEMFGTSLSIQELGLPAKARLVEADSNPKQTLKLAVQRSLARHSRRQRQRQADMSTLYEFLGLQVSLDKLQLVPAYQQFVNDLTLMLKQLQLIQD